VKDSRLRRSIPLALVLLVAAAVRVVALVQLRQDLSIRIPLLDAKYYLETAARLADGMGWPPGPHFMAPLYPFLLSGLFRVATPGIETIQWAQLVLGIVTTGLVFVAARRIDPRAGVVAGLFYALCGPAVIYENEILMEALLAFLLIASIVATTDDRPAAGPLSWIRWGIAGLTLGAAATGRPTYALLLPVALLAAGRSGADRSRRLARSALVVLGFLAVVGPPSLHNLRASGSPSFVTVSGGLNFFIGNNPAARGVYSQPPGLFLEKDFTGASTASRMSGRTLDAAGASRYFTAQAWRYLREQPGDALALLFRKAQHLLSPHEVPQIESVEELREAYPILRVVTPVGFWLLFPLALMGAVRATRRHRVAAMSVAVLLCGAVAHLVFFSTGRYRAAMLPALAVLAGSGVVELVALRGGWREIARTAWPVALAVGLMLLSPRFDGNATRAWSLHQAGVRYDQIGANKSAAEMYQQALQLDPSAGESWHNLAVCQARDGHLTEAIETNEKALEHLGEHPLTLYNLGILYGRLGMDERAIGYFDRSLAGDPGDPAVRVDRGVALYRLGRPDEAFGEWRAVGRANPLDPSLQRTLGRILGAGGNLPADLRDLAAASGVR
jgi:tetratricopeptide (TPR) repeat protein